MIALDLRKYMDHTGRSCFTEDSCALKADCFSTCPLCRLQLDLGVKEQHKNFIDIVLRGEVIGSGYHLIRSEWEVSAILCAHIAEPFIAQLIKSQEPLRGHRFIHECLIEMDRPVQRPVGTGP